jgi:hypothetical protein
MGGYAGAIFKYYKTLYKGFERLRILIFVGVLESVL